MRDLLAVRYRRKEPVDQIVTSIVRRRLHNVIRITLVTDISARTLADGATEISALLSLADSVQNASIVYLPGIHAKVYTSGTAIAIVTSANLTVGGLSRNLEYGVAITEPAQVLQVRADAQRYAALGGRVSRERLLEIDARVRELRKSLQEERRSISQKIREATKQIYRTTEDELLRARVAGRSITGIFAETVLYLLDTEPLSTSQIHHRISEIHPDLCDDTIDRVIDGQRFGKLWKHHVRNAQLQLKRDGRAEYDSSSGLWRRAIPVP